MESSFGLCWSRDFLKCDKPNYISCFSVCSTVLLFKKVWFKLCNVHMEFRYKLRIFFTLPRFFFFSSVYFLPSFKDWVHILYLFPGGSDGKESAYQCRRPRFNPWVGKIPWRRKWQPTPVFLPRKSHGHRSLVGCIVCGVTKSWTQLYILYHAIR